MAGIDLSINFGSTEKQSKAVTRAMNEYLKSIGEANDETEDLRINVSKYSKVQPGAQSATNKTSKSIKGLGESASKTNKQMSGLSSASSGSGVNFLAMAGAVGAAAFAVKEMSGYLINAADTMTQVENRLKLVTSSAEELTSVQKELFESSQKTFSSLTSTVDLYSRLARSTEEFGFNQKQILTVTESINQAFVVSGASAQEASAAVIQLGQGLASGALRGDELRSVLEQAPRLARALADGLGVSVGQLRDLGAEGALTTEKVFGALLDQSTKINEEFGKMEPTISQAFTVFTNSMTKIIGQIDEATGASENLAGAIIGAAGALEHLTGDWVTGIKEVFEGGISFWEFATSDAEELKELVKRTQNEVTDLTFKANQLRAKAARTIYEEDRQELIAEAEKLEKRLTEIRTDGLRRRSLDALAAFEKTNEETTEKQKKAWDELSSQVQDMLTQAVDPLGSKISKINKKYDSIVDKINKSKAAESDKLVVVNQVNASRDQEIAKLREAEELKTKEIAKELELKRIRESGFSGDAFDSRKELEEKVFQSAIVALNKEARDKENELRADALEKAKELDGRALEEKKEALEKEWEAVRDQAEDKIAVDKYYAEQYKEIEEEIRQNSLSEWDKWGESLVDDTLASVADAGQEVMEDLFFDVLKGDLDSFEDYWDTVWGSIAKTFASSVAQMASEKIVGTAIDFAVDAIFARDGLWEVDKDEQPVMAHKGEMVVPAAISEKLRDMSSDRDFTGLDQALSSSASSVYDGSTVSAPIEDSQLGPFGSGVVSGVRSKAVSQSAKGLTALMMGSADLDQIVNSYFGVDAIGGMITSGITSGFKQSLGLEGYWADIGSFAGAAPALLGASMLGPVGFLASAGAGIAGSAALDFVGDAVDMRSYEAFRDSIEDSGLDFFDGKSLVSQAITGTLDVSSITDDQAKALREALSAQKASAAGLNAFEENSFMGIVDAAFTAIGDFIDTINPFSWLASLFGFEETETKTLADIDAELSALDSDYDPNDMFDLGIQDYFDRQNAYVNALLNTSVFGTGDASSYTSAPSWTTTGTSGDWSNAATTSSSSSSYSGSSYSGRGGADIGLASGGMVGAVMAANPLDDGLVPMQMGEYVIKKSSAQSIGSDALEAMNQTGSIPTTDSGAIVINIVTQTGEQLKQFVFDAVKFGSERGVATIHADGIYGAV